MAELSPVRQARRAWNAFAAGALLSLGLGGCQLVPTAPAPSVAAPAAPVAQAEPEPFRPQPVQPRLPAADGTRHRIAVLVPTSGANAGVGQSIANAANLALLDTGGERIRITIYDTAKGAAGAAAQALADGNQLFLGPLLAEDVRAVAPVARNAGVPVVAFSNDISVAASGVYLMGFTPGQSIARVVDYARSKGARRFAALVPEGIYGRRASQAMIQSVQGGGGTLVGTLPIGHGSVALKSAATRLASLGNYDAVLIADSGRTAASLAPLLRGTSARILGTELWSAEGGLGATPALRGAWYAAPSDAMFDQLQTRYRARFPGNPYRLATLGYDAVLMTLRIARDWQPGRPFPEGELRNPRGFPGLDGPFRFDSQGIAERALEIREVTVNGTIVVSPAPRGFP
jgi:ABC-type branched-subunit amino acid transport system substrate-binding protein